MRIETLSLHAFRNYADLSFSPDKGFNLLIGRNAQGKTSLLEGIYALAVSRSWRASKDSELIKWDEGQARVAGQVAREQQNDVEIEVILSRTEKKQIRVNTIRQTRLADLMGQLNVVLIEAQDVEIVRSDPCRRRRFLDLEISQIQPQYCHLLAQYRRVLEQRNRLLKDLQGRRSGDGILQVWDEQLVSYGSQILERRLAFVETIEGIAARIHSRITDDSEILRMSYSPSVKLNGSVKADGIGAAMTRELRSMREHELQRGVTLIGPQRDDLMFSINDVDARVYASQGQQRTIALSLRLAEIEVMEKAAGEVPVVLLDDVMTDLDEERRTHVFETTRGRTQAFLTAASRKVLDPELLSDSSVYEVSGGQVIRQ